jgi:hypothetical protein
VGVRAISSESAYSGMNWPVENVCCSSWVGHNVQWDRAGYSFLPSKHGALTTSIANKFSTAYNHNWVPVNPFYSLCPIELARISFLLLVHINTKCQVPWDIPIQKANYETEVHLSPPNGKAHIRQTGLIEDKETERCKLG